jgi:predicted nucleic acid-binding protein
MMPVVIDSSYALALVLPDEQAPATAAAVLASELIAPFLFPVEVANAALNSVRRKRYAADEAQRVCEAIESLAVGVQAGPELGPAHLLRQARAFGLSAYDALYLDLAMTQRAALATCDLALADAARRIGVPVHD